MTASKPRQPRMTRKVANGLNEWIPVMRVLMDSPSDNDLQSMTEPELEAMDAAINWIIKATNAFEARSK